MMPSSSLVACIATWQTGQDFGGAGLGGWFTRAVTEYYLPLSANPDVYLMHRPSIKTEQYPPPNNQSPSAAQPSPTGGTNPPESVTQNSASTTTPPTITINGNNIA
jgi:hypothetical protein